MNGIDISSLGLDEEILQNPEFLEVVSRVSKFLEKETYLLGKKLEKLEIFQKRQTDIIVKLRGLLCSLCGVKCFYEQCITCDCTPKDTGVCLWCFREGKLYKGWRKTRSEIYWCDGCEGEVVWDFC